MFEREFYCDTCEGVQQFEAPPCPDGHGSGCPELACVGCGAAVLIATFTFPAPTLDRRRGRAVISHRRAA
ncbi:hypothetical protein ACFY3U_05095 [Micromonospora sp. NPDC000089]|uniref:hypothetical protein n=1 Tax=unclassified Micromonospora TaxID=2617518 RepID=UPI00368DCF50